MRRRGFIVNSTVLILLIPLLLLSATYSQVHYQIVKAQGEKMELEKLQWALSYLDTDFKNTLKISGKRAILAMVNYTITHRRYLSNKANETMKELMLTGKIGGTTSALMGNQTLGYWLNSVSNSLLERGLVLIPPSQIDRAVDMKIVPLTSFKVAIMARIENVTIKDINGKVVYNGNLPSRGFAYAIVDLSGIEDPVYAIATNGQYNRIINPCVFSYPEMGTRPIKLISGLGNSSVTRLVGTYGEDIFFNSTTIWSVSPSAKLFNLSRSPLGFFHEEDRGYLYFSNVSVPGTGDWVGGSAYKYRVLFTLTNSSVRQGDLVLLVIDTRTIAINGQTMNEWVAHTSNKASIIVYDGNNNPVQFWIEYWDSGGKLWLWIKATTSRDYYMYLSDDPSLETRGNPGDMFYLLDDFVFKDESKWHFLTGNVGDGWYTFNAVTTGLDAAISNLTLAPPFFVRWGMNTTADDTGVGLYTLSTGGEQNYLDVKIKYGPINPSEEDVSDIVSDNVVQWPYSILTDTATLNNLSDMANKLRNPLYDSTEWIRSSTDAEVAEEWLDSELAKINGSVVYEDYQVPVYLNATAIRDIEARGGKASIRIVDGRGNPLPFWIEYWNDSGALIWVRVNLTERYYTELNRLTTRRRGYTLRSVSNNNGVLSYTVRSRRARHYYVVLYTYAEADIKIYYNTGHLSRGSGEKVFEFFDDFNESLQQLKQKWIVDPFNQGASVSIDSSGNGTLTISGGDSMFVMVNKNPLNLTGDFAVDFRMKPNFNYVGDWDAGVGLWDGRRRYYDWDFWYDYYLLQQLFTDDITYGGDPLAVHWAEWRTEDGSTYELYSFWAEEDSDSDITTNRNYAFHKYEIIELLSDGITYFKDLSRNETNTYDSDYTTLHSLKYVYLVIDSEYPDRGATFDWLFVRKYLNPDYLNEKVSKHEGETTSIEYEATGSSIQLAVWKEWSKLTSIADSVPSMSFQRYELNVTSSLSFGRVSGPRLGYDAGLSGSWNVSIVSKGAGTQYFDWIIIGPPYALSGINVLRIEEGGEVNWNAYASVAFDLQPFLSCLVDDRYFGLYSAPSFFERLEGKLDPDKTGMNGEYWEASKEMQDKLGIAKSGQYYPIGLVSFIYYPADSNLVDILPVVGQNSRDPNDALTNAIPFADYYWLPYYFTGFSEVPAAFPNAYRVWGISMGTGDYSYLSGVGFLLDNETAVHILGESAWKYLRHER
ncbi:DUF2341 domain-containing protein [Thermococcus sp.]|uniref:DUF2341 domain-containing protein n=1 Tax=Thermococcus sp. TaxID=35749 RepID=UPI00260E309A|nr:DUF2341 domain-containing protein [Thermococcus sp.]